ncbi:hypothetical protein [Agriterribacter sp.]|uniref:hypothetical protein n=1 Tax=Agriterribacter sp. TaxID=2821509 RepID=UPI002B5BFCD0|nr:hypothetical protein [Agriterribacter sp.]HTN05323.1 hypothetical protein [Agriterribacter sp.]
MERNIHIDEFDEFLKEKADQYKMYPSDKVWNNIQRSVHPRKKWPYISLTLLLLLGTAVFIDYHTHNFAPAHKLLTFNNDHFKSAGRSIAPGTALNKSGSASVIPSVINDAGKAVDQPLSTRTPFSKKLIQPVNPSLYPGDDGDNSYADNGGREIEGSETLPDHINTAMAKPKFDKTADENDEEGKIKKVLWGGEVFKKSKFEWQLFFSPTVSYRKLTSDITEVTDVFKGVPYSTTQKSTSVNNLVTHKPAIGAEVGANVIYKLTDNFLLRAGLQLNYSRYQLRAYASKPEQTTLAVVSNPLGTDSINVISTLQNFSGSGSSWYNNEYFQVSLPVGFEWGVLGNSTLKWNIAASAQPVYNFANNIYLLSTDFKRYGQDPSLIRKWNINAGVETYVSYNMGSFKWQAGPQLRYQLISSYKSEYPVKEYLVDFGFKIGVTKTIR